MFHTLKKVLTQHFHDIFIIVKDTNKNLGLSALYIAQNNSIVKVVSCVIFVLVYYNTTLNLAIFLNPTLYVFICYIKCLYVDTYNVAM